MAQTQEFGSLREKIAAEKAERQARYAEFEQVWNDAQAAGQAAAEAHTPQPMTVRDAFTGQTYGPYADGVCGFAWVSIHPGTCSFARWAVKQGHASKAYRGGVDAWISRYGQSYERKYAHAQAMADVLRDRLGIKAYAGGRLD